MIYLFFQIIKGVSNIPINSIVSSNTMTSAVASKEYKLLSGSSTESATVSTLEKSYSIDSKMVSVSSTESSIIKDSTVSLVKSLSSLAGVSIEMTHSTEYKFASEYTAGLNFSL